MAHCDSAGAECCYQQQTVKSLASLLGSTPDRLASFHHLGLLVTTTFMGQAVVGSR